MQVSPLRSLTAFSSLAALAAASLVLGGCSGEVDGAAASQAENLGHQSSAVQGGTMDTNAAHNFAVGVANKLGGVCSGTLIAPNLVLTARHCVVPPVADETVTCANRFADNVGATQIFITTEPNLYRAKAYYNATEIITPDDKAFCGNDIALIVLEKVVPAAEAQPATPVVQFKMTDKRISGDITAMGYGITNPSAEDSGQRRIRQDIPLLCIPGSSTMDCTGANAKLSDNPGEFVTAGYVCSGDSGSGAFDQKSFDNGTPYVLGALSRGPQTADQCLSAIYSRTDAHRDLIVAAGLKAAAQGKYAAPTWTIPQAAAPGDSQDDSSCNGDACTDTNATDPTGSEAAKKNVTSSSCSASGTAFGFGGSTGASFAVGLALAAIFAARRRRSN